MPESVDHIRDMSPTFREREAESLRRRDLKDYATHTRKTHDDLDRLGSLSVSL